MSNTEKKPTLVIGASPKPERYSNMAVRKLLKHNHPVFALGGRDDEAEGVKIETGFPDFEGVHTVTMYMNAQRQKQYYDYILGLKPKRIIFNPGAENPEFMRMAEEHGIEVIPACTLVMLSTNQF